MFNIACNKRYTLLDLVTQIANIVGHQPDIRYTTARAGDVPHSLAEIKQAQTKLGYEPKFDLSTGLEHTVRWFREKDKKH